MRILRIAIPIVIALILGTVLLVSWLDPLKVLARLPVDAGKVVISGTKITMQAPKLTGYTRDRRWYELSARAAAQDITKPDVIELHDVRAKLEAQDKSTMALSAVNGAFSRKAGVLNLNREIVLKSSSGYEMQLDEATVDTASGGIVSNKPVKIMSQQGTLNAERLEVEKSGDIIRFSGVVLNLNAVDPAAAASGVAAEKPADRR
ncbi:MAG: LPS export ABC transporter periplasmic protein LptC [Rhizobiales bacterium]|nr:LPS export ABC transporter periplasmic protein LptC [Hyphomicrobiales bacterium]